uniref:RNase H type-1 domain-containing protein n=1 Tax=Cajanus cajan TaxID=3821 RepID=A0A151R2P1_CAJCA|nr:hypothetical protein KK1_042000 [Cajanus cajan]
MNKSLFGIMQAKLWIIYHDLKITGDRSFTQNVIVESDSTMSIYLLNEEYNREHTCYALVNRVISVVDLDQHLDCFHIFREAN